MTLIRRICADNSPSQVNEYRAPLVRWKRSEIAGIQTEKNHEQFDLPTADYIFCPWPKQPCALSAIIRTRKEPELKWLFRMTWPAWV